MHTSLLPKNLKGLFDKVGVDLFAISKKESAGDSSSKTYLDLGIRTGWNRMMGGCYTFEGC